MILAILYLDPCSFDGGNFLLEFHRWEEFLKEKDEKCKHLSMKLNIFFTFSKQMVNLFKLTKRVIIRPEILYVQFCFKFSIYFLGTGYHFPHH